MIDVIQKTEADVGQFGIGQAVRRKEDVRFLTGAGQYSDDQNLPGQVYAYVLRSPHAHARILGIDTAAARKAPGVVGVFTGADVANLGRTRCAAPVMNRDGSNPVDPGRLPLAVDRARHVGDPVALIVAESLDQAKDAAELIEVSYDALPAVTHPAQALRPGAPQIWEEAPGNVSVDWGLGDEEAVKAAFAKAHRVVKLDLDITRIVVASIEARSVLADYDPASERFTIRMGTQGVFTARGVLAGVLGVRSKQIRILTGDVGGSFGMKGFAYPEHSLMPWAAREVGRPVKWTSDRQEAFLSDSHGREQQVHAELALDAEAKFLAIKVESLANMGAYLSLFSLLIPTLAGYRLLTGAYRIPAAFANVKGVFTNTVWVDAYRGAGRPETSYVVERLVDQAAQEAGISRDEIRRRNFIPQDAMPYETPMTVTYDSGDFQGLAEKALKQADWAGFETRRAEARKRGKLRGIGMASYLEVTANGPPEGADIKFKPDGRIQMGIGCGPSGQGHETAFAQILEDRLGLPLDRIDFVWGDSDVLTRGGGTGGAKTLMLAGTALVDASEKIIAKGRKLAGHFLEAAEVDIEFRDGVFAIGGTDRSISILDLASRAREASQLPEDVPNTLDEMGISTSDKNTFPNGCHVCELEIDEETGVIRICRYVSINDLGVVVNPMIVEGQIHGGIVQGMGQTLLEHAVYDESGQLLTGSFMDYGMPHADDVPSFEIGYHNVPCTTNALGIKGCGEAGSVGALPSVMNAVVDALSPLGITHIDMPASPRRVWQAIQQARGKAAA